MRCSSKGLEVGWRRVSFLRVRFPVPFLFLELAYPFPFILFSDSFSPLLAFSRDDVIFFSLMQKSKEEEEHVSSKPDRI